MAPQTSYSIDIPAFSYPGQIADNMFATDVLSAIAAAAAVPYGVLVVRDATNTKGVDNLAAKVPALSTDITAGGSAMGIVLADQARAQDPSVAVATYPIGSALPVCKVGRVVVLSETAVVDGQPVYARFATGSGGSQKGSFRADSDSGTAALVPDAIWIGNAVAGFAVVELALL